MFSSVAAAAKAEHEPESQAPAEVWLTRTLQDQRRMDFLGRWVTAPTNVALGGAVTALPLVLDTSLASSIAYFSSGAFILTSALATWANEDPFAARRAHAFWVSLGFAALGTGLVLSCVQKDAMCASPGIGRRFQIGAGLFDAGFFIANALTVLLMPPPSASEIELSVKNLSAAERRDRVITFLERRDHVRRVQAYIAAPWGAALGGYLLGVAHEAPTGPGEILTYSFGAAVLALNIALFIYEHVRRGDADRLRAGEYP